MYNFGQLFKPTSLKEASNILRTNSNSMMIAGGTDILIKLRDGHFQKMDLVSIRDIPDLYGIKKVNKEIYIGALSSFTEIIENNLIKKHIPILVDALKTIGGPQVRQMGTVGGNICNGITSADSATSLLVLNADALIYTQTGTKTIPLTNFYISHAKVKLEVGEILKAIVINESNYINFVGKYYKYAPRNAMDIALTGCAVYLKLCEQKKSIADVRFAFGASAPIPIRGYETEKYLIGLEIEQCLTNEMQTKKLQSEIENKILLDVNPRTSWKGTQQFRKHIAKTLGSRLLKQLIIIAKER